MRRYLNKKSNTYVTKGKDGRFTGSVRIGRSLAADRARHSKHVPTHAGMGNTGDYRRKGVKRVHHKARAHHSSYPKRSYWTKGLY